MIGTDAFPIVRPALNLMVCTRDLDYGVGSQIKYELHQFDSDSAVKSVIVVGPKRLEGYSKKIRFEVIPTIGRFFITKEPWFAFQCNRKIKEVIKREKVDAIYLHFPVFANSYGVETIRKVHLLHRSILRHYPRTPFFLAGAFFQYLYSYFDWRTIRYASQVHFVGRTVMQDAEYFYPQYKTKFKHRPNSIDKKVFFRVSEKERHELKKFFGLNDNKVNILFVGRLEPLKGITSILKVLAAINRTDIRLVVIGDGPFKDKVVACPFVYYPGKVQHVEMYKYYNACDLLVIPSYYETFGLVAFEALACGCRVLSRNVGDVQFVVDRESIFIDDEEFARKLKRVLADFQKDG